jgi:HNH endonuclease/AP2 domain
MTKQIITQKELKELLEYNPDTGIFTWNKKPNRRILVNSIAGFKSLGYISIRLLGRIYRAHRLAWLYMTGSWPQKEYIDHINGIKDDNRFCNLREATNSENCFNSAKRPLNTSGYKGVSYDKSRNKWSVRATINTKKYFIGRYESAEMAYEIYKKFVCKKHGEYAYKGL